MKCYRGAVSFNFERQARGLSASPEHSCSTAVLRKSLYLGNKYVPAANGTLAIPEQIFHCSPSLVSVKA